MKTQEITELKNRVKELEELINTILNFNFFREECPLNFGYPEKCNEEKAQDVFYEDEWCELNCGVNNEFKNCWLKYFKRLMELEKGEDNDE